MAPPWQAALTAAVRFAITLTSEVARIVGDRWVCFMMVADFPAPIMACVVQAEKGAETALAEAREARRTGDYAAAVSTLERLLASEPQNADAWVQLGFAYAAGNDAARARAAYLRALAIAPEYDDAKFGLAQLAHRAGDTAEAQAWFERIGSARSEDADIAALRAVLSASPGHAWRWDVFGAFSTLSEDLEPWRETAFSLSRRDGAHTFGASIEQVARFGSSDFYGEVRVGRTVDAATWEVALGGASHPQFKPEAALRLEFATAENRDWTFAASLTLARYNAGEIDRFSARAGRGLGHGVRASAQTIMVRDEFEDLRTGYGVGATWSANDSLEFSVNWSDAPESSEGATIDVRALGAGVALVIAPDLRLRVGALREDRDAFDRVEWSLAATRTF